MTYESNLDDAVELGLSSRGEFIAESKTIEAIDNLIEYALKREEIQQFEQGLQSFSEIANEKFDEWFYSYEDPYAPAQPEEPYEEQFTEKYTAIPNQQEFQDEGFEETKNEYFNQEEYNAAVAKYQEDQEEYDRYIDEKRQEHYLTRIEDYTWAEWNKKKQEYLEQKSQEGQQEQQVANNYRKMIKTAKKKIPTAEELATYIEALKLYLKKDKIQDPVIAKLIKKLPYPDKVRKEFSNQECKLLFESVAFAWKKITNKDLVEETKIEHPPKGLEGNYWMMTGGVLLEGPNHFTIAKQNSNLLQTLLNISGFVMQEKMSSPPDEMIKTVIDHGGMRIFITKDKSGYFQLSADTYSKWGRKKIKNLDLKDKIVKIIDTNRPYKGWKSGILIKL